MKLYLLITLFILTSCTKYENPISEGPILNITRSNWYLERINDTGGSVHLKIVGSTNADIVTVKTFGDGLISDKPLELNSEKQFDEDIIISFSFTGLRTDEFIISTVLKAYKNDSILQIPVTSGKLKY